MTVPLTPAADQAVRDYLDDLGRMLEPAGLVERAEVLGQVREHLDAALTEAAAVPSAGDVSAPGVGLARNALDLDAVGPVLARLGPPAEIAASTLSAPGAWEGPAIASPGRGPGRGTDPVVVAGPVPEPSAADGRTLAQPWLAWVVVATVLALLTLRRRGRASS